MCDVSAGAGAGRVPSGGDDLPAGGHRYNIIIYIMKIYLLSMAGGPVRQVVGHPTGLLRGARVTE